jgi:hypothetical protein
MPESDLSCSLGKYWQYFRLMRHYLAKNAGNGAVFVRQKKDHNFAYEEYKN